MIISILFIGRIFSQLIIPKSQPNYRLSYKEGIPYLVDRAVNINDESQDNLLIEHSYTSFTNNGKVMCRAEKGQLRVCDKANNDSLSLWKIAPTYPIETKFYSPSHECITIGQYDKDKDHYSLEYKECNGGIEQLFLIVNKNDIEKQYKTNGISDLRNNIQKLTDLKTLHGNISD